MAISKHKSVQQVRALREMFEMGVTYTYFVQPMDVVDSSQLSAIWKQALVAIPVVFKRGAGESLMVRLPYDSTNRAWLKDDRRRDPVWNKGYRCWETPRAWFNATVISLLSRFGKVYVIQTLRREQKCAPACWNASGFDCECSCMGEFHGSGNPSGRWHVVDDTFAVCWGDHEYGCRLLKATNEPASDAQPAVPSIEL